MNKSIFNNSRKIISASDLNESDMITVMRDHFLPNKIVNAIYISDKFLYRMFEETFLKYFSISTELRIVKCQTLLDDIENESDLYECIKNEHNRNNHRGITENYEQLRQRIYHPQLKIRIQQYVNNCQVCNIEKYVRNPIKQKYMLTETPDRPQQVVHVDVFYSLQKTLFLTIIDKFSKYAQAIKIHNRSWIEFKRAITQFLSIVGSIGKIVTDNELGFKALPLMEFLGQNNIEIHFTSNNNHY